MFSFIEISFSLKSPHPRNLSLSASKQMTGEESQTAIEKARPLLQWPVGAPVASPQSLAVLVATRIGSKTLSSMYFRPWNREGFVRSSAPNAAAASDGMPLNRPNCRSSIPTNPNNSCTTHRTPLEHALFINNYKNNVYYLKHV